MTRSDLQRMADGLPAGHIELSDSLRGKPVSSPSEVLAQGPYTCLRPQKVVIYRFPEDKVTADLYGHFKTTEWLLQAGPGVPQVAGELTVTLFERAPRRRPLPESGICYHATEIGKQSKIEKEGLRIGVHCGQQSRDKRFPDSIYYIYAADSLEAARSWCDRLQPNDRFVIFPIRIRDAACGWLKDPCGDNATAFIIEVDNIPPQFLGSAIHS